MYKKIDEHGRKVIVISDDDIVVPEYMDDLVIDLLDFMPYDQIIKKYDIEDEWSEDELEYLRQQLDYKLAKGDDSFFGNSKELYPLVGYLKDEDGLLD